MPQPENDGVALVSEQWARILVRQRSADTAQVGLDFTSAPGRPQKGVRVLGRYMSVVQHCLRECAVSRCDAALRS